MRILIACDKFKGSLTAPEACEAIRHGITEANGIDSLTLDILPVADGGDGLAHTLTEAQDGQQVETTVTGPLRDPVSATYGILPDRIAVIEMAEASGIVLLSDSDLDPWNATTFGTGELILDAMARGVNRILLGIGGSATNDGGSGMLEALGFQFLDSSGEPIRDLPRCLGEAVKVAPPDILSELPPILVACDVTNPLLGPSGCTRIYGPQKGIAPNAFEEHEKRLEHFAHLAEATDETTHPGAGAAGGMGFGCLTFLKATLRPGFDLVSETLELEEAVQDADLVITGEGSLDAQSLEGKAPAGVAQLAKGHGKPVVAFCGIRGAGELSDLFGEIVEIRDPNLCLEENLKRGSLHLARAARVWAERFAAQHG